MQCLCWLNDSDSDSPLLCFSFWRKKLYFHSAPYNSHYTMNLVRQSTANIVNNIVWWFLSLFANLFTLNVNRNNKIKIIDYIENAHKLFRLIFKMNFCCVNYGSSDEMDFVHFVLKKKKSKYSLRFIYISIDTNLKILNKNLIRRQNH